jgi:predicted membrane metal-binding protein
MEKIAAREKFFALFLIWSDNFRTSQQSALDIKTVYANFDSIFFHITFLAGDRWNIQRRSLFYLFPEVVTTRFGIVQDLLSAIESD